MGTAPPDFPGPNILCVNNEVLRKILLLGLLATCAALPVVLQYAVHSHNPGFERR